MPQAPVVYWFRNDLRLADNAGLAAAIGSGAPVICVFVLDDETPGNWRLGGASRWWLHHSLDHLSRRIADCGSQLVLLEGAARRTLPAFVKDCGASAVYFSRCYEPYAVALEQDLKRVLDAHGIEAKRFGGALLREPEDLRTKTGDPFKVYTPYWRAVSSGYRPPQLRAAPISIACPSKIPPGRSLASLKLLPTKPDWAGGLRNAWRPGEAGAHRSLDEFLSNALKSYAAYRNRPDLAGTSRLSPHLHFGEISPAVCWSRAAAAAAAHPDSDQGCETFLKELVWREFSYNLLVHWPTLHEAPFRPEFSVFPWRDDDAALNAWQKGATGYPIVDAGMRELWQTGYMHNRVRMIAASFLIKDLLVPWQQGEAWFWDTLVDADLASNAASWQWVAGSGADAAPYFRIFNPVTQGLKFDPDGTYVRRYVPELSRLEGEHIHAPWLAPAGVLAAAGVKLGKTYPAPIVDHARAREAALIAYETIKSSRGA